MSDHVVTLNAGSSSVKFAFFAVEGDGPRLVASGQVEEIGAHAQFHARVVGGACAESGAECDMGTADHRSAICAILDWIERTFPHAVVAGIGHRVVHGGVDYAAPVVADASVIAALRALEPLAPLHQPHNLAGLSAAHAAFPTTPQVICFDTAFHRGHAFVDEAYALPIEYYRRGLHRFGFHGLSYEYIARRLRALDPVVAGGRVIVAHLGAGASLCALRDGRSVASTMGFSALEGLPMATRCGQIDPGLLLYLLDHDGLTSDELADLLYKRSGLKGLSGVSQDMRDLEASAAPEAAAAIDYFAHRIRIEIGALAAAVGGVDALVFTAGIGEHSATIREKVCSGLNWLGFAIDPPRNGAHETRISPQDAPRPVFVLVTDEEAMIAHHTIEALRLGAAPRR